MSSFHEVQEQLLLSYEDGILDEDEFLLLHEQFMPKNANFSYEENDRFSLDEMNDAECLAEFRFRKHDLQIFSEVLQMPDSFRCYQRSVVDGMEGLCILLRRLSYPCRYSDMISRFGLPVPVLSMVSNDVLDFIYNTHRHRITQWNHNVLNPAALQIYSNAIADKGAALHNCFGFVDGTVRPVCRPGEHQRVIYNGHKRVHALKFQCVALPNGLIGNLFGPVGKFCGECLYKERVGDFNFTMFLTRNIGRVSGVKSERLMSQTCTRSFFSSLRIFYFLLLFQRVVNTMLAC